MAAIDDLAVAVGQGHRNFGVEELQHIPDGVYAHYARARPEAVLSELSSFRRIRELNESVVHRFAEHIASGRWPRVEPVALIRDHEQTLPAASRTPQPG
jgi:hypothetical protein